MARSKGIAEQARPQPSSIQYHGIGTSILFKLCEGRPNTPLASIQFRPSFLKTRPILLSALPRKPLQVSYLDFLQEALEKRGYGDLKDLVKVYLDGYERVWKGEECTEQEYIE